MFKLDYFEFPLLAVGSFPAGEKVRIDLFGGPTLAFNTSAKIRLEFLGEEEDDDIKSDTKSTDFGVAVGAGLTILAGESVNVVLDGRYTIGLTNWVDVENATDEIKNNSLAFMAGLSFPIGQGAEGP